MTGGSSPAIGTGNMALTSTRLTDGTWLWVIDQPVIARRDEG
ncbi:MAG TPA: hypothetical protein VK003_18950 [Oceanobacillus sp.]|nr:hypothetical protein [Oceanobacillus sp.]